MHIVPERKQKISVKIKLFAFHYQSITKSEAKKLVNLRLDNHTEGE